MNKSQYLNSAWSLKELAYFLNIVVDMKQVITDIIYYSKVTSILIIVYGFTLQADP